jgi:hypothetical protein
LEVLHYGGGPVLGRTLLLAAFASVMRPYGLADPFTAPLMTGFKVEENLVPNVD